LALAGRTVILRKGKPADPNDFKDVCRIEQQTADERRQCRLFVAPFD